MRAINVADGVIGQCEVGDIGLHAYTTDSGAGVPRRRVVKDYGGEVWYEAGQPCRQMSNEPCLFMGNNDRNAAPA